MLPAVPLLPNLEARTDGERSIETVAARDLARYYRLLARELRSVRLTEQEAMLVWQALTQVWAARADGQAPPGRSLVEAVDAEYQRLAGLSSLDRVIREDLLVRLAALSRAQELALLDACERMMVHIRRQGWSDIPTLLRTFGFACGWGGELSRGGGRQ